MLTILLFIDCSKMAQIRINTRTHTKEKPYLINFYFFKIGKAQKVNRVSKIRVYVYDICAEGIFLTFPWWLKNVKSRSKIALFLNEHHFEIWFPKKRTITFFWSKLSKLHKKRPNFACGNCIFPKTRGNKNKPWTHSTPLKGASKAEVMLACMYLYHAHSKSGMKFRWNQVRLPEMLLFNFPLKIRFVKQGVCSSSPMCLMGTDWKGNRLVAVEDWWPSHSNINWVVWSSY